MFMFESLFSKAVVLMNSTHYTKTHNFNNNLFEKL